MPLTTRPTGLTDCGTADVGRGGDAYAAAFDGGVSPRDEFFYRVSTVDDVVDHGGDHVTLDGREM